MRTELGSRRRLYLAWILLVPLFLVIGWGAATLRWHSCTNVDHRSYLEMIQGVSEHGLPYLTNGPAESVRRFPELRARWNIEHDGRLWGTYSPAYAYLAAPAFMLGGITGVLKFNLLCLALVIVAAFGLGHRLVGDPLAGTATAYLTTAGASIWFPSADVSPYTITIGFLTGAAYCAVRSLSEPRKALLLGSGAGLLGGLATASHILVFPMVAVLLTLTTVLEERDGQSSAFVLSRKRAAVGLAALGGFLPALIGVSALNHVRFGNWNPISYGPCEWQVCASTGLAQQGVIPMLRHSWMLIVWVALTGAAVVTLRRSRLKLAIALLMSMTALLVSSTLRDLAAESALLAWGFVVNFSGVPLGPPYSSPSDHVGLFLGPFMVRSLLQCTPALALAPLAVLYPPRGRRAAALLLALTCAGMLAALVLRLNLDRIYALGFPFLNVRYVLPIVPLLSVLAVAAAYQIGWQQRLTAIVVIVSGLGCALLWRFPDQSSIALRSFLVWGTTIIAVLALALAAMARSVPKLRQMAQLVAAITFATSVATTIGIDLRATLAIRSGGDQLIDRFAKLTPQRFALIGWTWLQLDWLLALRSSRDMVYADLTEAQGWANLHALIEEWQEEGRPVFSVVPPHLTPTSPWPDIRVEVIDPSLGLCRLVFK